jgi:hypothetical protein
MFPVICISEALGVNDGAATPYSGRYVVFVAAFKSEAALTNFLKRGMNLEGIGDQLLFWHNMPAAPSNSFEEAMQVATTARANPASIIGQLGVPPATRIYFAMPGQPAEAQE